MMFNSCNLTQINQNKYNSLQKSWLWHNNVIRIENKNFQCQVIQRMMLQRILQELLLELQVEQEVEEIHLIEAD